MLRNFRQVFKGNQMPMTVVMVVVLLGMVAYLAPGRGDSESQDAVMARVYGREILRRDVEQKVSDTIRRLGKQANLEAMGAYLQSQALDYLVGQKLAEELAEEHGIVVTDAEVASTLEARLRMYPVFLQNGQLRSTAEINAILKESGTSLNIWEKEVRLEAEVNKLKAQAAAAVPVDEAWLQQENRLRNEQVSFETVTTVPDPAGVADPGDAKLQAFLSTSGSRFQVGPRRILQYVSVQAADFGSSLEPDEASLKSAYDSHQTDYLELKTSHILFTARSDSEFLEATRKAEELRAKLIAGQDFNKTALELSQDPSAKSNRGELGWMAAARLDKGYVDGTKGLKEGEISHPVRSAFGIHLIRLEGRKVKPFEEVKPELKTRLAQERFVTRAKDRLEQIRKAAGKKGDLSAPAQNQQLKAQLSRPLANEPGAQIDGLGSVDSLMDSAFALKVGEVSKVMPLGDRFVVFRVKEEQPSAVPPLADIRARVLAAYRLEEVRKQLMAASRDKLQKGGLTALGTPTPQKDIKLASLGELIQQPAIRKALLDTAVGQTTPLLWTPDGHLWAARIISRTPAPALTFGTRQSLVEAIQSRESIKVLQAELQALELKGRTRPGLSSLWGRFGGIWLNQAALARTRTATSAE
nr:peptidyl-prolyl cis-trans isomerase [uncultured Holophaga sp.]